MTANGTAGGSMNPMSSILVVLHKAGRLLRQILLGGLVLLAAGILALATAILGVLVTIAALVLRFRLKRQTASRAGSAASGTNNGSEPASITLEARQTGDGWTVE